MERQCPSSPPLCANGCGFYGSAATNGLCSKCYARSLQDHRPGASSSPAPLAVSVVVRSSPALQEAAALAAPPSKRPRNRCGKCNRKTGPAAGFTCRCGTTFCGAHRYPEEHGCEFDFKTAGRASVAKNNPLVKADKLADRI